MFAEDGELAAESYPQCADRGKNRKLNVKIKEKVYMTVVGLRPAQVYGADTWAYDNKVDVAEM